MWMWFICSPFMSEEHDVNTAKDVQCAVWVKGAESHQQLAVQYGQNCSTQKVYVSGIKWLKLAQPVVLLQADQDAQPLLQMHKTEPMMGIQLLMNFCPPPTGMHSTHAYTHTVYHIVHPVSLNNQPTTFPILCANLSWSRHLWATLAQNKQILTEPHL